MFHVNHFWASGLRPEPNDRADEPRVKLFHVSHRQGLALREDWARKREGGEEGQEDAFARREDGDAGQEDRSKLLEDALRLAEDGSGP